MKIILGAALFGAALIVSSPAHADPSGDFGSAEIDAAEGLLIANYSDAAASADVLMGDNLANSTQALVMGSTGIPTPGAGYIEGAFNLYLEPNGYAGTIASAQPLTTPETFDFLSSVQGGQNDLVNAIVSAYESGDMGCDAGVCSDPMTIFAYSQSSAVAALAEQQLADAGIPKDALHFIMLGANPIGVPDSLYSTDIYNIDGDAWAQPLSVISSWDDVMTGMVLHLTYFGLTQDQISDAVTTVDGLTSIHDIPTLTIPEIFEALVNVWDSGGLI